MEVGRTGLYGRPAQSLVLPVQRQDSVHVRIPQRDLEEPLVLVAQTIQLSALSVLVQSMEYGRLGHHGEHVPYRVEEGQRQERDLVQTPPPGITAPTVSVPPQAHKTVTPKSV